MKKLLIFLTVLVLSGCGVWEDFTTYFNLYYNTVDTFQEVEETISAQKKSIFSNEDIVIPGSASQLITKVIEKCSNILQFHSESAYIDDALLMLGKSFYYQKNYQKALRKFQELTGAETESDLALENQLWIGKTYMRLKDFTQGLETLRSVRTKALDEGYPEILKESYIEEIKYQIGKESFPEAITLAAEFLNVYDEDEVNAEVEFELGRLYNKVNDPQNAVLSFEKVFEYSPAYQVELDTRLELGKALRASGEDERALDIFQSMRNEDKFRDQFDVVDLELGTTLNKLNRLEEALEILHRADTSYQNSVNAGMIRFVLGEIYEYKIKNFDSAYIYYQKAVASPNPPEYVKTVASKNQLFKKYATLNQVIFENEKQLRYILDPDEFIKDSIAYYDTLYIAGEFPETELESPFQGDSLKGDSLKGDTTKGNIKGELFGQNQQQGRLGEEQQGRLGEQQQGRIGEETQQQGQEGDEGQQQGRFGERGNQRQGRLGEQTTPLENKRNPPVRPVLTEDSVKSIIVKNKFELGNLFFTEFNLPDSAYYYYMEIISGYPNSLYQARVLYALGSYYLTQNDSIKADSLFNIVYEEYKEESIVNAAASKLDKPLIDLNYDPAEDIYIEAEKEWLNKNYESSIRKFYNIFLEYPNSSYAPKALFATGFILENELNMYDSAAIVYDSMQAKYPQSVYASKVAPKLVSYKQEKQRIQQAYEDSIRAVEQSRLDSIDADSLGGIENQERVQIPDSSIQRQQHSDSLFAVPPDEEMPGGVTDSLQLQHQTIIDSLQRGRGGPDSLNNEILNDSLNPGRRKPPK